MDSRRFDKKSGCDAARRWLREADPAHILRVAGMDFRYGDRLTVTPFEREDADFAWGFYKQVKSHALHRLSNYRRLERGNIRLAAELKRLQRNRQPVIASPDSAFCIGVDESDHEALIREAIQMACEPPCCGTQPDDHDWDETTAYSKAGVVVVYVQRCRECGLRRSIEEGSDTVEYEMPVDSAAE